MRAKQVMVSTISRKSPYEKLSSGRYSGSRRQTRLPRWALIAGGVVLAVIVYAWIDGGYRDVHLIEEELHPVTAQGDAMQGDGA